jgi:hypothetical protein
MPPEENELSSKSVLDSLFQEHFNLSEDLPENSLSATPEPVADSDEDLKEISEAASRLMGMDVTDDGEVKVTGKAPVDGAPEKVNVEKPDAEKPVEEVKEKVVVTGKRSKKKEDEVAYEVPKAAPPTPRVPVFEHQEDLSFLSPEQRDEYNLIRFGEQKFPDRFRGKSKELLQYFKAHDEFVQKRAAELDDQGEEFDSHDPEYQKWLKKNQPKFSYEDRRDLREEMLTEKVLQKVNPRLRQQEEEIRLQKVRPIHDQMAAETILGFEKAVQSDFDPEDKFETELFQTYKSQTRGRVGLYLALVETPEKFDPNNHSHQALDEFITRQGKAFLEKGGAARIKNGKKFLPVSDFLDLPPGEESKYWTFTEGDIVRLLRRQSELGFKGAVENHRKRMTDSGYIKQKVVAEQKPVKEVESPKKPVVKSPKVSSAPTGKAATSGSSSPDLVGDIMSTLFRT